MNCLVKRTFVQLDKFGRQLPQRQGGYYVPNVTVDALNLLEDKVLVIRRKNLPFQGKFAFPGGYVDYNEDPLDACKREVLEETGLIASNLQLVDVKGSPLRDPRGHTISIIYKIDVQGQMKAGDDASEVSYTSLSDLENNMAFDHWDILTKFLN